MHLYPERLANSIVFKVSVKVKDKIDKEAEIIGITRSEFLSNLVTEAMNKKIISHQKFVYNLGKLQTCINELQLRLYYIEIDPVVKTEIYLLLEKVKKGVEKLWQL